MAAGWPRAGRGGGGFRAGTGLNVSGLESGRVLIIEPGPALGFDNLRFRARLSHCKQQILSPGFIGL